MKLSDLHAQEMARFKEIFKDVRFEDAATYAAWLSQTYYFARQTTTLLSLASAHSEMNSQVQFRFNQHAAEERGHDKLLKMDLKKLGRVVEDAEEASATSSLYQSQYYWIQHNEPRAFFGYVLFLEGLACDHGDWLYARATGAHGREAGHFLKVHSAEDVDHVAKALDEVSKFDEVTLKKIERNYLQTSHNYEGMLRAVMAAGAGASREKKSA